MRTLAQIQDVPQENAVFDAARTTIRTLLAAYVLAAASAILINPSLPAPLGGLFGPDATPFAAATLFVTGGALLIGMMVRTASVILSLYLLLSGIAHVGLAGVPPTPGVVGSDLTLLATVLLVMLSEGGHARKLKLKPRRIRPLPAGPMAEPPSSRRLDRASEEQARRAVEIIAAREAQRKAQAKQLALKNMAKMAEPQDDTKAA